MNAVPERGGPVSGRSGARPGLGPVLITTLDGFFPLFPLNNLYGQLLDAMTDKVHNLLLSILILFSNKEKINVHIANRPIVVFLYFFGTKTRSSAIRSRIIFDDFPVSYLFLPFRFPSRPLLVALLVIQQKRNHWLDNTRSKSTWQQSSIFVSKFLVRPLSLSLFNQLFFEEKNWESLSFYFVFLYKIKASRSNLLSSFVLFFVFCFSSPLCVLVFIYDAQKRAGPSTFPVFMLI